MIWVCNTLLVGGLSRRYIYVPSKPDGPANDHRPADARRQRRCARSPIAAPAPALSTFHVNRHMLNDMQRWRLLIEKFENRMWIEESSGMRLEGWWIKPDGELLECDHDHDWHHAQIALDYYPPDDADDLEADDDDGGDVAIMTAYMDGWIRGSYVPNEELAIGFRTAPTKAANRTLIAWMQQHDIFPSITIHTPTAVRQFEDMAQAIRLVRSRL